MAKDKEPSKFGDTVLTNVSLDYANAARSYIKINSVGFWVFVHKGTKSNKYNVSCQNAWGGQLSHSELYLVKSLMRQFKDQRKKDE